MILQYAGIDISKKQKTKTTKFGTSSTRFLMTDIFIKLGNQDNIFFDRTRVDVSISAKFKGKNKGYGCRSARSFFL